MSARCRDGCLLESAGAGSKVDDGGWAGPLRYRLEWHSGGDFRLYLVADGAIVAALDGRRDDGDVLVSMLFVTPERRRQGLAQALVRALRERFPDCMLRCGHDRRAAQ